MHTTYTGILSLHTLDGTTALFLSGVTEPVATLFANLDKRRVTLTIKNIDVYKPLASEMYGRVGVVHAFKPGQCLSGGVSLDKFNILSLLKSHVGNRVSIEINEHPIMTVCMSHPVIAKALESQATITATPKALLDYLSSHNVTTGGTGALEITESEFKISNWPQTYRVFLNGYPVAYCTQERLDFEQAQS